MHITLRQLKAFLAGTKCATFSEAAKKSFLTQPAYSLMIKQLESELGVKLFDRTTRSVSVTKSGEELSKRLERVLQDLDETLLDSRESASRKRGRVTIGFIPSLAASVMGKLVATMVREFPRVTLAVKEELSGPLAEMVASGEVDLAIGVDLPHNPDVSFTPLVLDPMVGAFHPRESILSKKKLTWTAISQLRFISFARSSVEESVRQAFASANVRMETIFDVKFAATAVSLVREGLGFTVLPELATGIVDLNGLVLRPIHPLASRKVGILVHAEHSLSPAAAMAVELATTIVLSLKRPASKRSI